MSQRRLVVDVLSELSQTEGIQYKLPYVKASTWLNTQNDFKKTISQVKLWNPTFRNPPTPPIKVPLKGITLLFPGGSISYLQSFSHFSPKTTQTLFQDLGEMTIAHAASPLEKGELFVVKGDDESSSNHQFSRRYDSIY